MKKTIPLLLAVLACTACEKEPDMSRLDHKFMVYTNYDTSADFATADLYYLPDSILLIGNSQQAEYWKDEKAQQILGAYADNMENRGYTRTANRDEADLGIQISYVENTYRFADYGRPEWWWSYPGYWNAPYWGNWGGWYYPYAVTYSYSTGSFLTELLNLNAPQGESAKLPVVWSSYMTGVLNVSATTNVNLTVGGIDQAFAQSPYLQNNHSSNENE